MHTYDNCVSNQTDSLLNALNSPQDFLDGMTSDEIYDEYGKEYSLKKCDFNQIMLDDIPQGTGLTFIAIAGAVVHLPGSYIFAILFYALIAVLAVGSMIGTLEGVLTPIADFFWKIPKIRLMTLLCVIHFVIGILFTTGAGINA